MIDEVITDQTVQDVTIAYYDADPLLSWDLAGKFERVAALARTRALLTAALPHLRVQETPACSLCDKPVEILPSGVMVHPDGTGHEGDHEREAAMREPVGGPSWPVERERYGSYEDATAQRPGGSPSGELLGALPAATATSTVESTPISAVPLGLHITSPAPRPVVDREALSMALRPLLAKAYAAGQSAYNSGKINPPTEIQKLDDLTGLATTAALALLPTEEDTKGASHNHVPRCCCPTDTCPVCAGTDFATPAVPCADVWHDEAPTLVGTCLGCPEHTKGEGS